MKKVHIHIHNKTKDGLEEAINLTSVLNKFPSLRAYGLSSIKYKSGEVYTVSTYDLPKEDLASLIAYVKSIKTVKDAASQAQIDAYIALRKETDKLAKELEKREDQGLTVTPAMRNKLNEARAKENNVSTYIKQAARESGKI